MNLLARIVVVLDLIVAFLAAIFCIGFFGWLIVEGATYLYKEFKKGPKAVVSNIARA